MFLWNLLLVPPTTHKIYSYVTIAFSLNVSYSVNIKHPLALRRVAVPDLNIGRGEIWKYWFSVISVPGCLNKVMSVD